MDDKQPNLNQGDSLEAGSDDSSLQTENPTPIASEPSLAVQEAPDDSGVKLEQPIDASEGKQGSPKKHSHSKLKRLFGKFNLYLVLFIFILVVGVTVFAVAFMANRVSTKDTVNTQTLTGSTLKQLANSDVSVGQPKQTLNVQSNAVFAGKVLVQDSLEVAGPIRVGGALSIPGITVSGNSVFDQVQVNRTLTVAGDSAFQGQISTQKSLSVAGGGTFGGAVSAPQLSVNTLQLNGDLNLNRHITAGGPAPSRSNGNALGGGGTTSVSGSDSAGSINVNTGSGASAGCFLTVNFAQRFNATPHVLITPVGAAAAGIDYYVTRTTTSFNVCTASAPPSFASFGFDYFILD